MLYTPHIDMLKLLQYHLMKSCLQNDYNLRLLTSCLYTAYNLLTSCMKIEDADISFIFDFRQHVSFKTVTRFGFSQSICTKQCKNDSQHLKIRKQSADKR